MYMNPQVNTDNPTSFTLADATAAQVYLFTNFKNDSSVYILGDELPAVSQEIGKKVWHVRVFNSEPRFDGVHLSYALPLGGAYKYLSEDGTLFGAPVPTEQKTVRQKYEEALQL